MTSTVDVTTHPLDSSLAHLGTICYKIFMSVMSLMTKRLLVMIHMYYFYKYQNVLGKHTIYTFLAKKSEKNLHFNLKISDK